MEQIKKDFPLFKNHPHLVYLDSAATTQKPQQVIDAISTYYATMNAPLYRGIYPLAEQATEAFEATRLQVAQFINAAHSSEIIFTSGATAAFNMVALAFSAQLEEGDEVVVTELEHHANLVPWQMVCAQKKARLRYIPVMPNGALDLQNLTSLITEKTKLVAVTHVSNAIGTVVDLAPISARAHAVGACVVVDGCQAVPYQPVDVQALDCDFYVFSSHKALGPTGVGVLYVHKRMHTQFIPVFGGGGCVLQVLKDTTTFLKAPLGFEAGTPPAAQVAGFSAALSYLQAIGLPAINKYVASLTCYAIQELAQMPHIRLLGPIDQLKERGHLISFTVENMHGHDVAAYLATYGIAVRAGHHCAQPLATSLHYSASVRASFYVYTTFDDVAKLIKALKHLGS